MQAMSKYKPRYILPYLQRAVDTQGNMYILLQTLRTLHSTNANSNMSFLLLVLVGSEDGWVEYVLYAALYTGARVGNSVVAPREDIFGLASGACDTRVVMDIVEDGHFAQGLGLAFSFVDSVDEPLVVGGGARQLALTSSSSSMAKSSSRSHSRVNVNSSSLANIGTGRSLNTGVRTLAIGM